ncbi:MAG TPA: hypothetical protein DEP66_05220, partial [Acidimicrobiaceae bacterium]|nr:hypothetical protein [Acidimicrobiaceae bacterium]
MARRRAWRRTNYRGAEIVAVSGLVVVPVAVAATAALGVLGAVVAASEADWLPDGRGTLAALLLLAGFGALGFLDDLRGRRGVGGFVGHFRASLALRRPTTAVAKLVGGAAVSSAAVWIDGGLSSPAAILVAAAVVALSANLANLLDRAPGRAVKAAAAWWLVLLLGVLAWRISPSAAIPLAACAVGPAVGLLRSELAERHMLGDTGVNPLGAALGLATVAVAPARLHWVLLAALLALTALSERVSLG